ncbi:PAQR family membrane homeostasis protein TrhA [Inconstantimicrobium mannanitabidum]|uniref:Hemolysin D n=1 Tax=Inconstantimicrobium mannanitabidum TaxID=1604901 RepID=A0ACB5R696_9CLOT|nr:hemolysin III family protein [Clostridium sp. TW13]GKX64785.1 hemolysin D [Clostridium sp. TW13]
MDEKNDNFYTKGEEIANAITHGVGTALAIAALVILIIASTMRGTAWHVVSFIIYGVTQFILYLESTLYHSITNKKAKRVFRKFDHMSIFILIAGTYTPFCLTILRGAIGWTIFGIVWACAVVGIIIKSFKTGKYEKLSVALYIAMGWIIIIAILPLYRQMTWWGLTTLVLGGVAYTAGTYVFSRDDLNYNHGVWHLFVLAGSALHFVAVMSLLYI